jgi:membrane-anchored protein YejM (alkaline phosphatase superfamily)
MGDYRAHVEVGMEVYGRMLDLDDAHITDAVRVGMQAVVESFAQQHAGAVRTLDEILAAINELENEDALDTIVRIINDARGSL